MKKIFIDSTEFKAEPCRLSKVFSQLTQLAIGGFVEIHLSKINVDEIESWIDETIKKQESTLLEAITKASNFELSEEHFKTVALTKSINSEWLKKTGEEAKQRFRAWIKQTKTTIHNIDPTDGENVMASYFSGSHPFSSIKNRSDIPDAFIWQCLSRLDIALDDFIFVSGDAHLRGKVSENLKNSRVFPSLKDLFKESEIHQLIEKWEKSSKRAYTEALIEMIESEVEIQHEYICNELSREIETNLIGNQFREFKRELMGAITDVRFIDPPEFNIDYIQATETPLVFMKFESEVEVTISLAIALWDMSQKDYSSIDNILLNDETTSDSHALGEQYVFSRVHGEFLIELPTLDQSSGREEVIDAIEDSEIRISSIKIERLI